MPYLITSTEKTRSSASEFETKALLFLMNLCENHEDTYFYVIDVFNDVSAHSKTFDKSWDLQSKASKASNAKEIGRELVTLFKNYLSDFSFDYSILFIGGVPDSFRIDATKSLFGIDNIPENSIKSIKSGLLEESKLKTYIDDSAVNEQTINAFLEKVTFVIGDKSRIEYMHNCIGMGKRIVPRDAKLERMFSSIRTMQGHFKDRKSIEGKAIEHIGDALFLKRHLTKDSIRLKILSDLIGDSFSQGNIPNRFIDVLNEYDLQSDEREDIAEECYTNLCMVYYDLNNEHNFWKLFSHIYLLVQANKSKDVNTIYELSNKELFKKVRDLKPHTAKYFISLIMEVAL